MENYFKYLTVNPLEKDWGFYINTVGHMATPAQKNYPNNAAHPANHSFTWNKGRILDGYYLIFISKGEGIFESSKIAATNVTEGTCFFLYPGVWHRYKPHVRSGWEEYWVGFQGFYPARLMQASFFNTDRPFVNVGHDKQLLDCFQRLLETVRSGTPGYPQVATGITLEILALVHGISQRTSDHIDPVAKMINKAKFLLQENMEKPVNLAQLAKQLPMGYSSFRKAFKKHTGDSPNQYLLNLKLNKAKELLSNTHLSINEIALHTGFESAFYFSNLFKKRTGMPPSEYRIQGNEASR